MEKDEVKERDRLKAKLAGVKKEIGKLQMKKRKLVRDIRLLEEDELFSKLKL